MILFGMSYIIFFALFFLVFKNKVQNC